MESGIILEMDRVKKTGIIRSQTDEILHFRFGAFKRKPEERKEWWNTVPLFVNDEVLFFRGLSPNRVLIANAISPKDKKYLKYSDLHRGMLLQGKIVDIAKNAIILDIGIKEAPGIFYFNDTELLKSILPLQELQPGELLSLSILDIGNRHGRKLVYLAPKIDRQIFFDWAVGYLESCKNYANCDFKAHLKIIVDNSADLFKVKFYLNGLIEKINLRQIREAVNFLSPKERFLLNHKIGCFRRIIIKFYIKDKINIF